MRGLGRAGRTAQIVHVGGAGPDHPVRPDLAETAYLKALFLRLGPVKVALDACVLSPPVLREMLLGAAATGAFAPVWSARILEEWARATRRLPEGAEAPARAEIALMRAAWPAAEVAPDAGLVETLALPDPDDRHVLAAAIAGGAEVLLDAEPRRLPHPHPRPPRPDPARSRRIPERAPRRGPRPRRRRRAGAGARRAGLGPPAATARPAQARRPAAARRGAIASGSNLTFGALV